MTKVPTNSAMTTGSGRSPASADAAEGKASTLGLGPDDYDCGDGLRSTISGGTPSTSEMHEPRTVVFVAAVRRALDELMRRRGYGRRRAAALLMHEISSWGCDSGIGVRGGEKEKERGRISARAEHSQPWQPSEEQVRSRKCYVCFDESVTVGFSRDMMGSKSPLSGSSQQIILP